MIDLKSKRHNQILDIINNNDKISIATDIGHMTNSIINKLDGSSFILLEATDMSSAV